MRPESCFALFSALILAATAHGQAPKRDYRADMRAFVAAISLKAKAQTPGFLVVPQGGLELLTEDAEPDGKLAAAYLGAIDGVGQEEVFYGFENVDDRKTPRPESEAFLKLLDVAKKAGKGVLVTDYATKRPLVDDAYARNKAAGLVGFVADRRGLDRIPRYPAKPPGVNTADVRSFADVKNFLYLIDGGRFETLANYLGAMARTDHDLLIIDPFSGDWAPTAADIDRLKRKPGGGRRLVLCYLSIGEAEDYRPYWKPAWTKAPPPFLGPENPDWKGNFSVRYWDSAWRSIILDGPGSPLGRILAAGFDGVYLDKVDEYGWFEDHPE
ncbi:endo alpha-1,4 polygalactosaminidase [Isosphaeraceae bacterium EP7]